MGLFIDAPLGNRRRVKCLEFFHGDVFLLHSLHLFNPYLYRCALLVIIDFILCDTINHTTLSFIFYRSIVTALAVALFYLKNIFIIGDTILHKPLSHSGITACAIIESLRYYQEAANLWNDKLEFRHNHCSLLLGAAFFSPSR